MDSDTPSVNPNSTTDNLGDLMQVVEPLRLSFLICGMLIIMHSTQYGSKEEMKSISKCKATDIVSDS